MAFGLDETGLISKAFKSAFPIWPASGEASVAEGVFQAIAVLARSELRLAGREDVADRLM
jgi:hypothetical protein